VINLNSKENKNIQEILKNIPKQKKLDEGDIVIGKVVQTTDKIAIINIDYKDQKVLSPSATGILFINNASQDYVEKMGDVVRIGDIVKAKVDQRDKFGFKLKINEENLGVIKSYCKNCRAELSLLDNTIKCLKCKTTNTKKIGKM
jgi:exosome complex component CSL4